MSLSDDLYRDIILDHHRNPHHAGVLDPADVNVDGVNPLCGDECRITFNVAGGVLSEIRADSRGCAISRASTSMMTDAVVGKPLDQVLEVVDRFKEMLLGSGSAEGLPDEMADLEALEGVKVLPARIKCAILGWDTLLEGMKDVAPAGMGTTNETEDGAAHV